MEWFGLGGGLTYRASFRQTFTRSSLKSKTGSVAFLDNFSICSSKAKKADPVRHTKCLIALHVLSNIFIQRNHNFESNQAWIFQNISGNCGYFKESGVFQWTCIECELFSCTGALETFSTKFSEKTTNRKPRFAVRRCRSRFARKLILTRRSCFSGKRNGLRVFRTTFPRKIKTLLLRKMAAAARRDFDYLLAVISHQDSSDSSEDSSDEDDLDTLLLSSMFPDKNDFTRKNFEDLTNFECEEMFMQVLSTFYWISHVVFFY